MRAVYSFRKSYPGRHLGLLFVSGASYLHRWMLHYYMYALAGYSCCERINYSVGVYLLFSNIESMVSALHILFEAIVSDWLKMVKKSPGFH